MTNQDVVNVAVRVANRIGVAVTISGETGPTENDKPSSLFFKQLLQLGTGEGTGNHATLIKHGIQVIFDFVSMNFFSDNLSGRNFL